MSVDPNIIMKQIVEKLEASALISKEDPDTYNIL